METWDWVDEQVECNVVSPGLSPSNGSSKTQMGPLSDEQWCTGLVSTGLCEQLCASPPDPCLMMSA